MAAGWKKSGGRWHIIDGSFLRLPTAAERKRWDKEDAEKKAAANAQKQAPPCPTGWPCPNPLCFAARKKAKAEPYRRINEMSRSHCATCGQAKATPTATAAAADAEESAKQLLAQTAATASTTRNQRRRRTAAAASAEATEAAPTSNSATQEVRETMNAPAAAAPTKVSLDDELIGKAATVTRTAQEVISSLQNETFPKDRKPAVAEDIAAEFLRSQQPLAKVDEITALEKAIRTRKAALVHMEDASDAEKTPVLNKVTALEAELAKLQKKSPTTLGKKHAILLAKEQYDGHVQGVNDEAERCAAAADKRLQEREEKLKLLEDFMTQLRQDHDSEVELLQGKHGARRDQRLQLQADVREVLDLKLQDAIEEDLCPSMVVSEPVLTATEIEKAKLLEAKTTIAAQLHGITQQMDAQAGQAAAGAQGANALAEAETRLKAMEERQRLMQVEGDALATGKAQLEATILAQKVDAEAQISAARAEAQQAQRLLADAQKTAAAATASAESAAEALRMEHEMNATVELPSDMGKIPAAPKNADTKSVCEVLVARFCQWNSMGANTPFTYGQLAAEIPLPQHLGEALRHVLGAAAQVFLPGDLIPAAVVPRQLVCVATNHLLRMAASLAKDTGRKLEHDAARRVADWAEAHRARKAPRTHAAAANGDATGGHKEQLGEESEASSSP